MVTLTPDMAGTGLITSFVFMGIAFIFQIYMLYLNWKQSKVKDTTQRVIEELIEIKEIIQQFTKTILNSQYGVIAKREIIKNKK